MNAYSFYVCPHCKKEHGNPAKAAICCLRKNERWYCTVCGRVRKLREDADACCKIEEVRVA